MSDAENQAVPELCSAPSIRAIDLGRFLAGDAATQTAIAREVDEICRETGFLIIKNHGIDAALMDRTWRIVRDFFDLPLATKLASRADDPHCPRGYFPLAAESLAKSLGVDTPPDLKESLGIGPLRRPPISISDAEMEFHYGDNLWPSAPEDLRDTLTEYFNALEALGSNVLRLFAAALELPHDYFEQFHRYPMCALRCINYPAQEEALLPQQRGAGAHSDYGSITILKSDPSVPGLEIRLPDGQWAAAPLVGDAFIINIGDMMARWTNDRWVSTLHRVSNLAEGGTARRQSLAFFHNTSFDARIQCIPTCLPRDGIARYEPVMAGHYLASRFNAAVNEPEQ